MSWRAEAALLCSVAVVATCLSACDVEQAPAATGGLRLATVLGPAGDGSFARAETVRVPEFPADHGAHPQFRSEWWYLVSALADEHGNEFGAQFTLFRQALSAGSTDSSPWQVLQAYLGHAALTDVAAGRHWHAERLARGHPRLAGVESGRTFDAHIEDWRLSGSVTEDPALRLIARLDEGSAMDLRFTPQCEVVLQGEGGLSRKSADSASYYYSWPRLQVTGELTVAGVARSVRGLAWLDREWSTSVLAEHLSGWNWFALHLDDGRSIMVYAMNRKDGRRDPYDHGVVVADCASGQRQRLLSHADFELQPQRFWRDEVGRHWPVEWLLTLDAEQFIVRALVDEQLMDTLVTYWEGLVAVQDRAGAEAGRGYMELTGHWPTPNS